MAEQEQSHRHAIESAKSENDRVAIHANERAQQAEERAIQRGHYLGASVSYLSLITAVLSVYLTADWRVSVALVSVPVMSAVRAIILRK
jgi:uncharacterized membrane protein